MQKTVAVILTLLLFSSIISTHELGHAITAHYYGCAVESINIGIGPSLYQQPIDWSYLTEGSTAPQHTILHLRLIPIAAFVKIAPVSRQTLTELPLPRRMVIHGSGILMNFAFGCLLLGLHGLIWKRDWLLALLRRRKKNIGAATLLTGVAAVSGQLPLLVSLALISGSIVTPILIIRLARQYGTKNWGVLSIFGYLYQYSKKIPDSLVVSGSVAISLGIANLLPLMPLDGGQAISDALARLTPSLGELYQGASALCFLGLMLLGLTRDVQHFIRRG